MDGTADAASSASSASLSSPSTAWSTATASSPPPTASRTTTGTAMPRALLAVPPQVAPTAALGAPGPQMPVVPLLPQNLEPRLAALMCPGEAVTSFPLQAAAPSPGPASAPPPQASPLSSSAAPASLASAPASRATATMGPDAVAAASEEAMQQRKDLADLDDTVRCGRCRRALVAGIVYKQVSCGHCVSANPARRPCLIPRGVPALFCDSARCDSGMCIGCVRKAVAIEPEFISGEPG